MANNADVVKELVITIDGRAGNTVAYHGMYDRKQTLWTFEARDDVSLEVINSMEVDKSYVVEQHVGRGVGTFWVKCREADVGTVHKNRCPLEERVRLDRESKRIATNLGGILGIG